MPRKFVSKDGTISYAPLADGTLVRGRWRVLKTLGYSSLGAVYQVADSATGDLFALKEIYRADEDEEIRAAFEREAPLLMSLTHDALPRVFEFFIEGGSGFLVTEFIEGVLPERYAKTHERLYPPIAEAVLSKDFARMLVCSDGGFRFEAGEVLGWARQILDALEFLHTRGLAHRDVKPANLKLMPDGRIKLLDCAVGRIGVDDFKDRAISIVDVLKTSRTLSLLPQPLERILRTQEIGYSPTYNSSALREQYPAEIERFVAQNPIAAPGDIFSLGATLYKLLTRKDPWGVMPRAEQVWAGRADHVPPARDREMRISKAVSDVLDKVLALHPADRPTAAGLRRMIDEAEASDIKSIFKVIKIEPSAAVNGYELEQILEGHRAVVSAVAFSPDGRAIASGSHDRTIKLWDAASGSLRQTISVNNYPVSAVAFSPDGETFAAAVGASLLMWEAAGENRMLWRTFRGQLTGGSYLSTGAIAYSPDGNTIAAARFHRRDYYSFEEEYLNTVDTYLVEKWDARNGDLFYSFDVINKDNHQEKINSIAYSPDGEILASGSADGTIKLWKHSQLFRTLEAGQELKSVVFSPDGKTIAGSGGDTINLWSIADGELSESFSESSGAILSTAFAPDGNTIAAGGVDGKIRMWNAARGDLPQVLDGHDKAVNSIAFSPDGQTVASGSDDHTVILWKAI